MFSLIVTLIVIVNLASVNTSSQKLYDDYFGIDYLHYSENRGTIKNGKITFNDSVYTVRSNKHSYDGCLTWYKNSPKSSKFIPHVEMSNFDTYKVDKGLTYVVIKKPKILYILEMINSKMVGRIWSIDFTPDSKTFNYKKCLKLIMDHSRYCGMHNECINLRYSMSAKYTLSQFLRRISLLNNMKK